MLNYQSFSLEIFCDDDFLEQPDEDGTYELLPNGEIGEC